MIKGYGLAVIIIIDYYLCDLLTHVLAILPMLRLLVRLRVNA
jgi:hypothetical protein